MKQCKHILSLLLVLAVMAAGLCPAAMAADADREGWTAVSNADELAAISKNLSGKYYLAANIDLSGINWTPIARYFYQPFTGEFDGNGHVIKGLSVTSSVSGMNSARVGVGLFGCTSGAKLTNVSVIDANVVNTATSDVSTGILVGCGATTTIINCYTSGSVSSSCVYGTGGIVGHTMPRTGTGSGGAYILRCASSANVTSTSSYAGGIAGGSNQNIEECYFTGKVSAGGSCVGGIAGFVTGGSVKACWSSGMVSGGKNNGNSSTGGIIGSGSASYSYTIASVNAMGSVFNTTNNTYRSVQPAVGGGSAAEVYFEKGHFLVKNTPDTSWDTYSGSYLNGTGKAQEEMLTAETYTGWAALTNSRTGETVWSVEDGSYPQLLHTDPIPTEFPAEKQTVRVDFADGALTDDIVTGLEPAREVEPDTEIVLPAAPVRTNRNNWAYDFCGWSDGKNVYQVGAFCTATADVTFTATWTLHSVNGDNEWTYLDAMSIMDYLAGDLTLTDEQLSVADCNCDGTISYLDAMYIMDVLAGKISESL